LSYTHLSNPNFCKGDRVKAISGNFKNLKAVIVSVEGDIVRIKPKLAGTKIED